MKEKIDFSVISPVYKAKQIVPELVKRIQNSLSLLSDNYEIFLIDDGCPENSWSSILTECDKDNRIKGIKLSKNFGQHYAISAGLNNVNGEWIIVMDCDLQDLPEEIPTLFNKTKEGFDYVQARRFERKDNIKKKLFSRLFNLMFSYLSGSKSDKSIANFGIYHYTVVNSIKNLKEYSRSFPSLLNQVGYRGGKVNVAHSERRFGSTTYTFSKLLNLSIDVILVNSNKPLKITIKIGFLISFFSFLLALYNLLAHYYNIVKVPGYTSTLFSIWFVGGLNLFVLGVLGLYIGKIFDQVKGRPLYIIERKKNTDEDY
jgi:glycosyltransferase involved in cell wall biosynthesis